MTPACDWQDVQGLVLRGYKRLPFAECILVRFSDSDSARAWLRESIRYVTRAHGEQGETACAIALSCSGLIEITRGGAGAAAGLRNFSRQFTEGMAGASHRSRILGDTGASDPARWTWGGPEKRVDALVLACAASKPALDELRRLVTPGPAFSTSTTIPLGDLHHAEHFGFRDGISQPILEGTRVARERPHSHHLVKLGEMLLGYPDNGGFLAPVPSVSGHADFGRNGTYLVCRQLEQDVDAFESFVCAGAAATRTAAAFVKAKLVGRWPGGRPLLSSNDTDPDISDNEFGFLDHDRDGLACPIGAHIRRANPRDTLETDGGDPWAAANRHRVIRRGRSYGPRRTDGADSPPGPRGLLFIGLNADLERQFEFVQQNWLNDPAFAGLFAETDPLVGIDPAGATGGGTLTLPGSPARQRLTNLQQFVTTRGGEYFFLPGLRGLECLAGIGITTRAAGGAAVQQEDSRERAAISALKSTLEEHVREDAAAAATGGGPPMLRRDAHPKMHGCVQAELVVDDTVPDQLKHGVFAQPGQFRAWVRFSNAHGLQHDLELDPRGMAVKLLSVGPDRTGKRFDGETTQDFLFVTHDSFFVPGPVEFVDFPMALRGGPSQLARFFVRRRLWRGAIALMRSATVVAENPLTTTFFSQTPYRLGPEIVKLQARPSRTPGWLGPLRFWPKAVLCNGLMTAGAALGFTDAMRAFCGRVWNADGLRRAVADTLAAGESSFDICVQTRTSEEMPIEDPTVPWSRRQSPYRKVATLRIFQQPVTSSDEPDAGLHPAAAMMRTTGERLSFSPWHALAEHEPLGGINRARRNVYSAIASLRNDANRARTMEPSAEEFDAIRALATADATPQPAAVAAAL